MWGPPRSRKISTLLRAYTVRRRALWFRRGACRLCPSTLLRIVCCLRWLFGGKTARHGMHASRIHVLCESYSVYSVRDSSYAALRYLRARPSTPLHVHNGNSYPVCCFHLPPKIQKAFRNIADVFFFQCFLVYSTGDPVMTRSACLSAVGPDFTVVNLVSSCSCWLCRFAARLCDTVQGLQHKGDRGGHGQVHL